MNTIATEHLGLAAVHGVCASMNAIWRPTSANDLGVDGQIEFLESDLPICSGHLLAVQVKSGKSYFVGSKDGEAAVRPTKRQRAYWSRLPLPVIIVLHNPESGLTVFTDVKRQLGRDAGTIHVPLDSIFNASARAELLEIAERFHGTGDPASILQRLSCARLDVGSDREITGVEFLLACANLDQGYFELRMARLYPLLERAEGLEGVSWGHREYDWILRCTLLCWGRRLIEPFEEEFDYWWYDQEMVPDIVVALTGLGREVLEYLLEHAAEYLNWAALGGERQEEARGLADEIAADCQANSDRHDRSERLGEFPM